MYLTFFQFVIFYYYLYFHVSQCQRRIINGTEISAEQPKKYVVYLVKSLVSPMAYDEWICGGALVSPSYIITSAACVEDVKHLYVIAGYSEYITDDKIYTDKCTSKKKKKIIMTCIPKAYEFDYEKLEKWSFIDIAVVQVESPYDFEDKEFEELCSYIPQPIKVNYEDKYQQPDVDAIAMGWGHTKSWRSPRDSGIYNQGKLQYTSILLADKEECKAQYADYEKMDFVIDKYMICSIGEGNINSEGEIVVTSAPLADGCAHGPRNPKKLHSATRSCEEVVVLDNQEADAVESRKRFSPQNNTLLSEDPTNATGFKDNDNKTRINGNTRRHGICQNDHGGPIVTWVGSHEALIGVASVFKVSKELECIGPFLYTSTQCNGAFLDCILSNDPSKSDNTRRVFCDLPPKEKGFTTITKNISWKDHPDGPADNERAYLVRPLHDQHSI